MSRTITWEAWTDPADDEILEEFDEDDFDEDPDIHRVLRQIPNLITTPMGVFRVHDRMNPAKQFDCWTGHADFDITKKVKDQIESVEGVEALVILTRYRFFLGVGKSFKFRDVRVKIDSLCCGEEDKEEEDCPIVDLVVKMSLDKIVIDIGDEKHWAAFVFPNGRTDYLSTDGEDEDELMDFYHHLELYEAARTESGGVLFKNS